MIYYVYDFCGTIIKHQSHGFIKWFCLKKFRFLYFLKYFKNRDKILWDVNYLKKHKLLDDYCEYVLKRTETTKSFDDLKLKNKKKKNIIILTAAYDELVMRLLNKIIKEPISFKVVGSNLERTINGDFKSDFIKKLKEKEKCEVFFFTDSYVDFPAFKHSNKVILSEYSDAKCLELIDNNKIELI